MTLVLDAGALVAYEKGDRTVRAFLEHAQRDGLDVRTTTAVVTQVWRDGARQARLAMLLRGVDEIELTRAECRRIGSLLGHASGRDVPDASVVAAAADGDEILTSDPDDIRMLAEASGKNLIVTPI
ncbi:MAG: hypothetical protein H0V92_09345 [Pseudonocardiales bacterium]|nr:hypothetical protein [Pseudonocardiales bacterium]